MPKHYDTPDMKLHKKWLRNPDIRLSNKNRVKGTSSRQSADSIARALTLGKQVRRKRMIQKKRKQIKKISRMQTRSKAGKSPISAPVPFRRKNTKTPDATIQSTKSRHTEYHKYERKERNKQQHEV